MILLLRIIFIVFICQLSLCFHLLPVKLFKSSISDERYKSWKTYTQQRLPSWALNAINEKKALRCGDSVVGKVLSMTGLKNNPTYHLDINHNGKEYEAILPMEGHSEDTRTTLQLGTMLKVFVSRVNNDKIEVTLEDISKKIASSAQYPPIAVNEGLSYMPFEDLRVGMPLSGVVVQSTVYGAFIDVKCKRKGKQGALVNVNGLLHKSDVIQSSDIAKLAYSKSSLLLEKNTPVTVYVKEFFPNSGRFLVTSDPAISKQKLKELKYQKEASRKERRQERLLARLLHHIKIGQSVEGSIVKALPKGIAVEIDSVGQLPVKGFIYKDDLPREYAVPLHLQDKEVALFLSQFFKPSQRISCSVAGVVHKISPKVFNLILEFDGFYTANNQVKDDLPAIEIGDNLLEIYEELRGDLKLLPIQSIYEWEVITNLIDTNILKKRKIDKILTGLKFNKSGLTFEDFQLFVDNLTFDDTKGESDEDDEDGDIEEDNGDSNDYDYEDDVSNDGEINEAEYSDDDEDEENDDENDTQYDDVEEDDENLAEYDDDYDDEEDSISTTDSVDDVTAQRGIEIETPQSDLDTVDIDNEKFYSAFSDVFNDLSENKSFIALDKFDDWILKLYPNLSSDNVIETVKRFVENDSLVINKDQFIDIMISLESISAIRQLNQELFTSLCNPVTKLVSKEKLLSWDGLEFLNLDSEALQRTVTDSCTNLGFYDIDELDFDQFCQVLDYLDLEEGGMNIAADEERDGIYGDDDELEVDDKDDDDDVDLSHEIRAVFDSLKENEDYETIQLEKFFELDLMTNIFERNGGFDTTVDTILSTMSLSRSSQVSYKQFAQIYHIIMSMPKAVDEDSLLSDESTEGHNTEDSKTSRFSQIFQELSHQKQTIDFETLCGLNEFQEAFTTNLITKKTLQSLVEGLTQDEPGNAITESIFSTIMDIIDKGRNSNIKESIQSGDDLNGETVEMVTRELFDDLKSSDDLIHIERLLASSDIQSMIVANTFTEEKLLQLFQSAAGTSRDGLNFDEFKYFLTLLDSSDIQGANSEEEGIVNNSEDDGHDGDDDDDLVDDFDIRDIDFKNEEFRKLMGIGPVNQMSVHDTAELHEKFKKLSDKSELLSVEDFLLWDDLVEMFSQTLDPEYVTKLLEKSGIPLNGSMNFTQFKDIVRQIKSSYFDGSSFKPNSVDGMFYKIKKANPDSVTVRELLEWEFLKEVLNSGDVTMDNLAAIFKKLEITKDSKLSKVDFLEFLIELGDVQGFLDDIEDEYADAFGDNDNIDVDNDEDSEESEESEEADSKPIKMNTSPALPTVVSNSTSRAVVPIETDIEQEFEFYSKKCFDELKSPKANRVPVKTLYRWEIIQEIMKNSTLTMPKFVDIIEKSCGVDAMEKGLTFEEFKKFLLELDNILGPEEAIEDSLDDYDMGESGLTDEEIESIFDFLSDGKKIIKEKDIRNWEILQEITESKLITSDDIENYINRYRNSDGKFQFEDFKKFVLAVFEHMSSNEDKQTNQ